MKIFIPSSILEIVESLDYKIDKIGQSDSKVLIYDNYIMKINKDNYEARNEINIYEQLSSKLPIGKIIKYEIRDGYVYILREKLKGLSLANDYYMKRPKLLLDLMFDALKILENVDIKDLKLKDSIEEIINIGIKNRDKLDVLAINKELNYNFKNVNEIINYLKANKPEINVLCHGDLCLPNIICDGNKIVGFIDVGMAGLSNYWHDIAISYRSIKYNYLGYYGKSYSGFSDDMFFSYLKEENKEMIFYFLLLDELFG